MSWSVGSDDRYNLQGPFPETKRFKGAYLQLEMLEPTAEVRECISRDRTSTLSVAFVQLPPSQALFLPS